VLTKEEAYYLKMALKGFCFDANPRGWAVSDRKVVLGLVERGLMRESKPLSYDKHGAFVIVSGKEDEVREMLSEED